MADIKSREERSLNMAKIRSKDTKPEEYIRKKLYENGYRYRKNYAKITGHPDVWLGKYNTAIFVNGCYWHRHQGCKYAYAPKSKVDFWEEKFCVLQSFCAIFQDVEKMEALCYYSRKSCACKRII